MLATAVAIIVFAMSNPYLYPNPVRNTAVLYVSRAREMVEQQAEVQDYSPSWDLGNTAVYDSAARVQNVLAFSLERGTFSGSHGIPSRSY